MVGTVQSDNICVVVGGGVWGAEEQNTVGCVRTGSELRAGWVDHTLGVDVAGTVAKIDLRLPCSPCVRPPLLTPACPLISSPCDHCVMPACLSPGLFVSVPYSPPVAPSP